MIEDRTQAESRPAPRGCPGRGMESAVSIVVVVGNPKPRSRTYRAAQLVAEKLAGRPPELTVDLTDLGGALHAGGRNLVLGHYRSTLALTLAGPID